MIYKMLKHLRKEDSNKKDNIKDNIIEPKKLSEKLEKNKEVINNAK